MVSIVMQVGAVTFVSPWRYAVTITFDPRGSITFMLNDGCMLRFAGAYILVEESVRSCVGL